LTLTLTKRPYPVARKRPSSGSFLRLFQDKAPGRSLQKQLIPRPGAQTFAMEFCTDLRAPSGEVLEGKRTGPENAGETEMKVELYRGTKSKLKRKDGEAQEATSPQRVLGRCSRRSSPSPLFTSGPESPLHSGVPQRICSVLGHVLSNAPRLRHTTRYCFPAFCTGFQFR
jgi:hypothetical protein